MHRRAALVLLAGVAALFSCVRAEAALDEWALGFKAGTLGIGGELATNLLPNVNLRGSIQWFDLDVDVELDDIDYDLNIEMLNPMLLVDWYPFSGRFHLSGGVLFNGTDISLEATSAEDIEIGDESYGPDEIGVLQGESDFDDIAPYVGIGFGNPLTRGGHWRFSIDAGVVFIGSPDVDLTATGPLAANPDFLADLAAEEAEIEDDLDSIRICPVLSATLSYRF